MTAKIAKWGNSAAIRLPKEIMERLSMHIGDRVEILEKNHSVIIRAAAEKKRRVMEEARRIKSHAMEEYRLLEGSLEDGLSDA